jgi:hypothetical protein
VNVAHYNAHCVGNYMLLMINTFAWLAFVD